MEVKESVRTDAAEFRVLFEPSNTDSDHSDFLFATFWTRNGLTTLQIVDYYVFLSGGSFFSSISSISIIIILYLTMLHWEWAIVLFWVVIMNVNNHMDKQINYRSVVISRTCQLIYLHVMVSYIDTVSIYINDV